MAFLDLTFYANTLRTWLLALLAATLVFIALKLVRTVLLRSLLHFSRHTRTELDNGVAEVTRSTRHWFLTVAALFAGSLLLALPERLHEILAQLAVFALLLQIGIWGRTAIRWYVERYTARKLAEDAASVTSVRALGFLATLLLGAVLVLMALDNLGIDITALVASLGIAGVAVALAVQNVLGDLLASLSIVLDKPFVYGDFVVVDSFAGTVEHVGLKTTRLRSLSGEQLVFSNSDLLKSRLRNYKRMQERRIVFSLGVVHGTPPETLARIPALLRAAVEAQPDVRFDRAHFKEIAAASLQFEVVYIVRSPEYNLYMDRQQAINLEIFRRFAAEGIDFALPSQTLYLRREPAGEPAMLEGAAP